MELLPKVGIYIGIFIGLAFFTIFIIAIFPNMVDSVERDWKKITPTLSHDEILEKLKSQPAYAAFYDRFPDAKEQYEPNRNRNGELTVSIGNFEKYNVLRLELRYDIRDDFIRLDVRCDTQNETFDNLKTRGPLVVDFIQETNCLDINPTAPLYEYRDFEFSNSIEPQPQH